ncbi:MAG: alkaline phosphatase [Acidobacteria bacterium]|nr:alkaline phosphatase [Acidobacteriota bacterium]
MKKKYNRTSRLLVTTPIVSIFLIASLLGQAVRDPFPVKRDENPGTWLSNGWAALDAKKRDKIRTGPAKNVILFIGDGMGVSTLTAARILEGQMRGESGEENRLSFENFPFSALSKTYSANQQTSDSAPTMTAIVTGVKSNEGTIGMTQKVVHADYRTVKGNEAKTLLEYAEESGRSTGVITTTRVTHATPGACYAHSADRDWESDYDMKRLGDANTKNGNTEMAKRDLDAYNAKFPDIARQLIEFKYGDGLEVAFGAGRNKFIPNTTPDPLLPNVKGERTDGRDLTQEWVAKRSGSAVVYNKQQLAAIDPRNAKHVLGLFATENMQYETDRLEKAPDEPSLTDMTTKAIDILQQNKKGFFLMVEAGRIDQAHHEGNAYRALRDTIALSDAVRAAEKKVNLDDTLIIVTADHSHTLTISGYPARGNNILGLVREIGINGRLEPDYKRDKLGRPFTTLNYANGRGYTGASNDSGEGPKFWPSKPTTFQGIAHGRPDLTKIDTTDPNYDQESVFPLGDNTHGGEDVAIYAEGVDAHLFRGSMEENWTFFIMADALRLVRR